MIVLADQLRTEFTKPTDTQSDLINPWSDIQIIDELSEGLVLDGYYSTDRLDNFHLIIYDPVMQRLVRYIDTKVTKTNYYRYEHESDEPVPFNADIDRKNDLLYDKMVDTIELTDIESIEIFTNEYDRKRRKIHIPLPVQLMRSEEHTSELQSH